MKIYYVVTGTGATLIEASTESAAKNSALRDVGEYNGVQTVRLATNEDIQWIHAMGGRVPNTPRTRKMFGDKL